MSRTMFGKAYLTYRSLIGREYTSDSTGKMTGVEEGDVRDLVSVGCVDRDIVGQAALSGAPPGSPNQSVQYNNAGVLAGSSFGMQVSGTILNVPNGTVIAPSIHFGDGTSGFYGTPNPGCTFGSVVSWIVGNSGELIVGVPTGPAASYGDVNIQGAFKKNGVAIAVVSGPTTPASAAAAGAAGTVVWDSGFIYVCVATNTWKRVAIATW